MFSSQSRLGFALPSLAGLFAAPSLVSTPFQGLEGAAESLLLPTVAVLFARPNSVYKYIPFCDVFDLARDARTYSGRLPVVAHPPCRAWGRLRHMAKPRHDERDLAIFAVEQVRRCGGVLEHPAFSKLWDAAGLPLPGKRDAFGGFTLPVLQSWFGHRAPKATWLYFVGLQPGELPAIPFELGIPAGRIEYMGRAERERTPVGLSSWLVDAALVAGK